MPLLRGADSGPPAGAFPLHTLLINFVGALLIGFVTGRALGPSGMQGHWLLFLKVGVRRLHHLSTFSLEGLTLLEQGRGGLFGLYAAASVALCLLGGLAGKTAWVSLSAPAAGSFSSSDKMISPAGENCWSG